MNVFQSCSDSKDAVELYRPLGLYLKPSAKVNISVQLPVTKLPGKSISNWEVMEKLKQMITPEEFGVLKVSKSTIEFIRFEGEVENKSKLPEIIKILDLKSLKLPGFPELLKIRAAEAKVDFPTRHAWDSYFRDAKNMNEMKAGERPDTLHISNLPCKWFASQHKKDNVNADKPDEYIFRKVFEKFGEVRCVDVPMCDPYRNMMKAHISGIKMFSFGQDHLFEGYIQFQEYMGFVKAMDSLRGMKLLQKDGDKKFTANFKVEFDTTKHLSDASIRRRKIERDKLMGLERERDEKERLKEELKKKQDEEERLAVEQELKNKSERRKMREEKRKTKQMKKLQQKEAELMNKKIATEERKLLLAQRQLESIRLLDYLFERVKEKRQKEAVKKKEVAIDKKLLKLSKKKEKKLLKKEIKAKLKKEKLEAREKKLRNKLVKKFETVQEQELEEQREKLRKTIEGKNKLKSVLAATSAKVAKTNPKVESTMPEIAPLLQTMNPLFQDVAGYSGMPFSGGQQWYPTANAPYGFFENMPGFQPAAFNYQFTPGFQPRGGYFPRRQRGGWGPRRPRGFRRGGWTSHNYYQDPNNEEYYKYFKKLTKRGDDDGRSYSRSRSRSRSRRSRSRSRSRRRSHSRSRSRSRRTSHSRSRSRSRRRSYSKSRSNSRRRSYSRSHSRRRSRSKTRSRSRKRSRSRSGTPRSKRRSRTRSKSRSRSRTPASNTAEGKKTDSRSEKRSHGSRESSSHRSKSNSRKPPKEDVPKSLNLPSKLSSWSDSRNQRSRSRSWSQRQSRSPSLSKISSESLSNDNTPVTANV